MPAQRIQVPAADGCPLGAMLFAPPRGGPRSSVVLLAGAIGVRQTHYAAYAEFLAEEGFQVVTFDYRGVGASAPSRLRGFRADLRDWGEKDLAGLIGWIVQRYPEARLLYAAHSAGAQLLGLAENSGRVAAMLCVAAPSGYWGLWQGRHKLRLALLWHVLFPAASRLYGYFPGRRLGLGADLPAGVALNWARWGRHPAYIVDERGEPIRRYFRAFTAPIRAYSFADDPYAPRRAVEELLSFYENAPREHIHLAPGDLGVRAIGHLGFFKPTFRDSLWRETADWLRSAGPG